MYVAIIFYENYMDFWYKPVMHRGLKATKVFFSKLSLNIFVNLMKWNFTDSGEILEKLILTLCLNLVHIPWRLASLLQNNSWKGVGHGVRLFRH